MKKIIIFMLILIGFNNYLFADCCCQSAIQSLTQEVDNKLEEVNNENEGKLEELIDKLEELNKEYLNEKTTKIENSGNKEKLKKFLIENPQQLYQANALSDGMVNYVELKKEFIRNKTLDLIQNRVSLKINGVETNNILIKDSILNIELNKQKNNNQDATIQ